MFTGLPMVDGYRPSSASMPDAMPVVFVLHGDMLVREALSSLVGSAGWRSKTFACAKDFLSEARIFAPSCLILDVSLPDLSGLDLQKRIAGERNDLPTIFMTRHCDVPTTVRAMKAG